jgi:hypothetical protein
MNGILGGGFITIHITPEVRPWGGGAAWCAGDPRQRRALLGAGRPGAARWRAPPPQRPRRLRHPPPPPKPHPDPPSPIPQPTTPTPRPPPLQDGFSYASVEVSGFDASAFDPADLLARVTAIFRPGTLSVSLSVDAASRCGAYASWCTLAAPPAGYGCQSATAQELATGGRVSYYTFGPDPAAAGLAAAAAARGGAAPAKVLRHMPSFSSPPSSGGGSAPGSGSGASSDSAGGGRAGGGASSSGDESDAATARRARAAALAWAKSFEECGRGPAGGCEAAADAAALRAVALATAARRARASMDVANAAVGGGAAR